MRRSFLTSYLIPFSKLPDGGASYTFAVSGAPATPATGTMTVVYVMDLVGGVSETYFTLDTVFAKIEALSATERLALGGVTATNSYRVTIHYRPDLSPKMRLIWTPFRATLAKTLEVQGVQPAPGEPRRMIILTATEVLV